jgi:NDP-sugar pyrophosphorylase family protein
LGGALSEGEKVFEDVFNTRIQGGKTIKNVNVGPHAVIHGATELINGTISSCKEDNTVIGANVMMKDFIVSEGAQVNDGSILDRVFVGQAAKVGENFFSGKFFIFCQL